MECEHCRVGFGFRWESVEVESLDGVSDVFGKRFELLALQWL